MRTAVLTPNEFTYSAVAWTFSDTKQGPEARPKVPERNLYLGFTGCCRHSDIDKLWFPGFWLPGFLPLSSFVVSFGGCGLPLLELLGLLRSYEIEITTNKGMIGSVS